MCSFATTLRRAGQRKSRKTRLTIAEGHDEPVATNGDVLIFPDMVKYKGLGESDVESFVDEVLVAGKEWALGTPEPLSGFHVFICGHGSRDKRCGTCGPPLKETFSEELSKLGLKDQVFVRLCSHIGGHKYAGNVIIFGHSENGIVTGHWYGYVTPDDVTELIEQHICQGRIIDRLWRGQMGLTEDEQKERLQERIAAGSTVENEVQRECACAEVGEQGATNGTLHENGSLSQDKKSCQKCAPVLMPHIGSRDISKMCGDAEAEEAAPLSQPLLKDKKSRVGKFFKMPQWVEYWEADDTKVVLAVAGAATCVVLAYHLYRTSANQQ
ncbi:hypothetical protein CY35_01G140700 [Sphagnum magellanicum]|nr:hypothetical protein CY35_01G140700 [Sphagnum magellanicum]